MLGGEQHVSLFLAVQFLVLWRKIATSFFVSVDHHLYALLASTLLTLSSFFFPFSFRFRKTSAKTQRRSSWASRRPTKFSATTTCEPSKRLDAPICSYKHVEKTRRESRQRNRSRVALHLFTQFASSRSTKEGRKALLLPSAGFPNTSAFAIALPFVIVYSFAIYFQSGTTAARMC